MPFESEGIYYFFEHDSSKHTLILADSPASHQNVAGYPTVEYFPHENLRREHEHICNWSVQREVQSGKVTLTDYDFTKPKADLTSVSTIARDHAQSKFEVFDYPGNFVETSQGEAYAQARLEAYHASFQHSVGQGNVRGMSTGRLFTLKNFPRGDQNAEYLAGQRQVEGHLVNMMGAREEPI